MKAIFVLLFFLIVLDVQAQQAGTWRLSAHAGNMGYSGDLQTDAFSTDFLWDDLAWGISLDAALNRQISLRFLYFKGQFSANDRDEGRTDRSLNVLTELQEGGLQLLYYPLAIRRQSSRVQPYLGAGLSYFHFTPYANLFNAKGERYYYWSDGLIYDLPETNPGGAQPISQDNTFETRLDRLATEEAYEDRQWALSGVLGISYRLWGRLGLRAELAVRYAFTDYLDDVSGNYRTAYDSPLQIYAANPTNREATQRGNDNGNDWYYIPNVAVSWRFGRTPERFTQVAPIYRPGGTYTASAPASEDTVSLLPPPQPGEISQPPLQPPLLPVSRESRRDTLVLMLVVPEAAAADSLSPLQILGKQLTGPDNNRMRQDSLEQYQQQFDSLQRELAQIRMQGLVADSLARLRETTTITNDSLVNQLEMDSLQGPLPTYAEDTVQREIKRESEADTLSEPEIVLRSDSVARLQERIDSLQRSLQQQQLQRDSLLPMRAEADSLSRRLEATERYLNQADSMNRLQQQLDSLDQENQQQNKKELTDEIERLNEQLAGMQGQLQEEGTTGRTDTLYLQELMVERNSQEDQLRRVRRRMDALEANRQEIQLTTERVEPAAPSVTVQPVLPLTQNQPQATVADSLPTDTLMLALQKQIQVMQQQLMALEQQPDTIRLPPKAADTVFITPTEELVAKLFFATGKSQPDQAGIDELQQMLDKQPLYRNQNFELRGYSDPSGDPAANRTLSLKRAQSVKDWLMEQGVPETQITVRYFGANPSLQPNRYAYGRRVEVYRIR